MAVQKHTTPAPQRMYQPHVASHDDTMTPDWIVNDARRMGARTKRTTPLKPTDPPPPMHPILPTTVIKTLDVCWDCGGSGKTGSILHRCPFCGIGWTWEQMEALAKRDPWGKWIMPCGDVVPSIRIKKEPELCPTCLHQPVRGHIVMERTWGDIANWIVEIVRLNLGITEATTPLPQGLTASEPQAFKGFAAGFGSSEPTAPTPHTPHSTGAPVTPPFNMLPPLGSEDTERF